MLTTLVISCCLVFIFLQLTNPYISLAKNAIKHTTTETYLISYRLANIHNIIKTISLAAYANAKYGLLLKVRYTARKLVVTDIVLGMMLAVLAYAFRHFKYALLPPLINRMLCKSCLSNAVRFLSCRVALLPFSDCPLCCWSALFYYFAYNFHILFFSPCKI